MANVLALNSPLMRQTVGFDRFNDLFETLMNDKSESFDTYPPYNIEKLDDDTYRVVMAVAGFREEDLEIILDDGQLSITGMGTVEEDRKEYLHRGIASRSFKRSFRLADYIHVTEAVLKDGLLTIDLIREIPEEKKPRTISIKDGSKFLSRKKK